LGCASFWEDFVTNASGHPGRQDVKTFFWVMCGNFRWHVIEPLSKNTDNWLVNMIVNKKAKYRVKFGQCVCISCMHCRDAIFI
jgi:hypothetical protein